jgi:enamine deaminase RidA (YjgF/YER057c/UK114 family)
VAIICLGGIVKNVAEMQLQTERNLEGAFKDLDALIREAEEMVRYIVRLMIYLVRMNNAGVSGGSAVI